MKHVFKATKLGWEEEKENIWYASTFPNMNLLNLWLKL